MKTLMMIKKDAGEIGSGHYVTALYELSPSKTNRPHQQQIHLNTRR